MKALAVSAPGQAAFVDIPEPGPPGLDEALVRVRALGLCGSDLATFLGVNPLVHEPRIIGHEIAAEVVEVGGGESSLRPGDQVVVDPIFPCGKCRACRIGRYNCCVRSETLGVQRDGAACPYLRLPISHLHPTCPPSARPPTDVPVPAWEEAALVEPMAVGWHAAIRGEVASGDRVCLIGCGPIGLAVLQAAVQHGARVLAVDVKENSRRLALELGADAVADPNAEDVLEAVRRFTRGDMADLTVEAAGVPAMIEKTPELTAHAGRIVWVGYGKGRVTFDPKIFLTRELDVRGSRNSCNVFPEVIKHVREGRLKVRPLITHVFDFQDGPRALAFWRDHRADVVKIVLRFD